VALSGASPTGPIYAGAAAALERAVGELAPRAAADSGVFATVRVLQGLVEAARTGARCDGCAGRAVRGLLHALPAAGSLPQPRREPVVPLARRYFDLLRTGR
jgi:hypothetical protein